MFLNWPFEPSAAPRLNQIKLPERKNNFKNEHGEDFKEEILLNLFFGAEKKKRRENLFSTFFQRNLFFRIFIEFFSFPFKMLNCLFLLPIVFGDVEFEKGEIFLPAKNFWRESESYSRHCRKLWTFI